MSLEKRKNRIGRVVSNKMTKTVIVAVQRQRNHYLYKKARRMTSKFYAHDGQSECSIGDLVRIEECRPLSALKRWRVTGVLERRETVEVTPPEVDQSTLDFQSDEAPQVVETDEMNENTDAGVDAVPISPGDSGAPVAQQNGEIQGSSGSVEVAGEEVDGQLESSNANGDSPEDGKSVSDEETSTEQSRQ